VTSRNLGREEDNRLLGAEKSDTRDAHDISSGDIYGPRKNRSNGGVLIVYECWEQLVITNQSNPPYSSVKKIPAELFFTLKTCHAKM
jgi:hypothetical protein